MLQKYENPPIQTTPTLPDDEQWMRRCLWLARQGVAGAPPNPMVGAVVVFEGRIIGEGYHRRCGGPHAEVFAIESVKPADRHLLPQSTLYVCLEPCAHYGHTPPCAELIVRSGIKRVVVGCIDPFARVSGRGVDIMRRAGIEVVVGVLEKECRALNRRFITHQTKGRPYITLKWAASADGFIDAWRDSADTPPERLSTDLSMIRVHQLRARHQAILVGHHTLRLDRPRLTVRHWHGQDPVKVVLGRVEEGELPAGFRAFADIPTALKSLAREGVQSLLVEGGSQTLQAFIDCGLWDEAYEELSERVLGSGVPIPRMPVGVMRHVEQAWGAHFIHWENTDNGDEDNNDEGDEDN